MRLGVPPRTSDTVALPAPRPATGDIPLPAALPTESRRWYFAEGSTRAPFDVSFALQNPNPLPTVAHFLFLGTDGKQTPFDMRPAEPRDDPFQPGLRPPVRNVWLRAIDRLPDDPALHRYLLAYASDFIQRLGSPAEREKRPLAGKAPLVFHLGLDGDEAGLVAAAFVDRAFAGRRPNFQHEYRLVGPLSRFQERAMRRGIHVHVQPLTDWNSLASQER